MPVMMTLNTGESLERASPMSKHGRSSNDVRNPKPEWMPAEALTAAALALSLCTND